MAAARLAELGRLREFSLAQAERLMELPRLLPVEEAQRMFGKKGTIQQFDRITRVYRQIVVLECELRGLFNGPDRDAVRPLRLARSPKKPFKPEDLHRLLGDLHGKQGSSAAKTRMDYRTGPMADVVAGIRKVLGVDAPKNDPFAPRHQPRVRPVQAAPAPKEPAAKPGPAMIKLPEKPQVNTAIKAAALALQAKLGGGFHNPPAKPKTRQPNPARPPKRRRNRGPPK